MATGKCLRCDKIAPMTEDHVVPQWFNKALVNFRLEKLQDPTTELVCKECNSDKGGKLLLENERVRAIIKSLVSHYVEEIRKFEEFTP